MLRCFVLDDERVAAQSLTRMLDAEPHVEVVATCTDPMLAVEEIRRLTPDVIFLDIRMPELDGFAVLKMLAQDAPPIVIFTTAFDDFALEAFEVAALDYLLKPFDAERLRAALARAQSRHGKAMSDDRADLLSTVARYTASSTHLTRIPVALNNRIVLIDVQQITWLEADGKHVKLHVSNGQPLRLRHTMNAFDERLDPEQFVRVSRAAIVNLSHIQHFEAWGADWLLVMKNGERITSTANYRSALRRILRV